jgi:hypothetical protein
MRIAVLSLRACAQEFITIIDNTVSFNTARALPRTPTRLLRAWKHSDMRTHTPHHSHSLRIRARAR